MKDYFVYLPESPSSAVWGCSATSVGYSRVRPRMPYPPVQHPEDHHFTWARGRILQAFQIILISEGGGTFESAASKGVQTVEGGSIILLFPGVWHRYAPRRETGWVEHWIECRGPGFERALADGLVDPASPIQNGRLAGDVATTFSSIHIWATDDALANQNLLSTLGMHLLALIVQNHDAGTPRGLALLVQRAKMLILERYDEPLKMEDVARELKLGYSHFRQLFKARTGISPKQYQLEVRLGRARDFLANTDKSVKEIASILGFHSAFHFSNQFKAAMGVSPSEWKTRFRVL